MFLYLFDTLSRSGLALITLCLWASRFPMLPVADLPSTLLASLMSFSMSGTLFGESRARPEIPCYYKDVSSVGGTCLSCPSSD